MDSYTTHAFALLLHLSFRYGLDPGWSEVGAKKTDRLPQASLNI